MIRRRHRTYSEARMDMLPLMDVIFQILIFFMYTTVLMVKAEILPIKLATLSAATAARDTETIGITINKTGGLFLNLKPISEAELRLKMAEWAGKPTMPPVYIANESQEGTVDRLPLFVRIWDMLREVGVKEINLVGQPKPPTNK